MTEYMQAIQHLLRDGEVQRWGGLSENPMQFIADLAVNGDIREQMIRKYSFAIPDDAAIQAVRALGCKVLEIGAGSGYWAYELRKAGVDIIATDTKAWAVEENRPEWKREWTEVLELDALTAVRVCDACDALLIVWPHFRDTWAGQAVQAWKGQYVIYVGEERGGCTGDAVLYDELRDEARWERVATFDIPVWEGIHDWMRIYRRKGG